MQHITVGDVAKRIEQLAPLHLQESYDNAGLIVGDASSIVSKVLVCLDITEDVVLEAVHRSCQLIVAHHPIIFKGLKRLVGASYVERTVMLALKHNVALYAAHTNLDSVVGGVNTMIAQKIGLEKLSFLAPNMEQLKKLVCFVPRSYADVVSSAMFSKGAGHIGAYDSCSFQTEGTGTFRALAGTKPFVGKLNELHREAETRLETIVSATKLSAVLDAMIAAHPYEEVAYDVYALEQKEATSGTGMIGYLAQPMDELQFLHLLKERFRLQILKHTMLRGKQVHKVAICGGSCSFMLQKAIAGQADVFVSADFKYHEYFDAEGKIVIADLGHYESEQFTKEVFVNYLRENFPNFVVHLSEVRTNPVFYL